MTPLVRASLVWLVLFDVQAAPFAFYGGALFVLSVNRFYLATAVAVVPRLVPTEDLLMANSMSIVGGTVALLAGVFVGGWMADLPPGRGPRGRARRDPMGGGLVHRVRIRARSSRTSFPRPGSATRSRACSVSSPTGSAALLAHHERSDRSTITVDQMGQGIVLVLSLFVFRDLFEQDVGSFSNLIGAGGVGVLLGILTVGKLEERFAKERIVAGAFLIGGIALVLVATTITGWSVLLASFAVGLTFAWKKIPVDTMVQEAIPDGYRGRVFTVYDVAYNLSRVVAAFLAIPMLNAPSARPGRWRSWASSSSPGARSFPAGSAGSSSSPCGSTRVGAPRKSRARSSGAASRRRWTSRPGPSRRPDGSGGCGTGSACGTAR